VKLLKDWIKFEKKSVTLQEEKYTPWVIEPAFGIGRVIAMTLEHNFHMRDEKRTYFALPPRIAPTKVSLLPVISHE
jgi:glycyl-tRNA synthetase